MIIDIRCRPPYGQFLDYFNAMIPPDQRPQSFAGASMELWFDEKRQAGIAQAVAAGGINPGMCLGHRNIAARTRLCRTGCVFALAGHVGLDRCYQFSGRDRPGTFRRPFYFRHGISLHRPGVLHEVLQCAADP